MSSEQTSGADGTSGRLTLFYRVVHQEWGVGVWGVGGALLHSAGRSTILLRLRQKVIPWSTTTQSETMWAYNSERKKQGPKTGNITGSPRFTDPSSRKQSVNQSIPKVEEPWEMLAMGIAVGPLLLRLSPQLDVMVRAPTHRIEVRLPCPATSRVEAEPKKCEQQPR